MVDENEYRTAYERINPVRCVFEKTLTSLNGKCHCSSHFWLADREGYACEGEEQAARCRSLLAGMRRQSRFLFKMHEIEAPLPHNKEIRVQCGGLQGLVGILGVDAKKESVDDISALIDAVILRYSRLDNIPFDEVMPYIAEFKPRPSRRKR